MGSGRPREVVLIGTGGFAIEMIDLLPDTGVRVRGVVGPRPETALSVPWLGEDEVLAEVARGAECLVVLGAASLRRRLTGWVQSLGLELGRMIHPRAWVAPSVRIGAGAMVYPHATVHAGAVLGAAALINSNASVGHETVVGDFANVGPGAAIGGKVIIGDEALIGIGASVRDCVRIASGSVVGAGAAVVSDLDHPEIYVGVPARRRG